MELSDFVRETLVEIAKGIRESMDPVRECGGLTNPLHCSDPATKNPAYFGTVGAGWGSKIFLVDFDVDVTVTDDVQKEGKAKLAVAGALSVGFGGDKNSATSASNRIRFKIPLALPFDDMTKKMQ